MQLCLFDFIQVESWSVVYRCEAKLPVDAAEIQATGARLATRGRSEAGEAFFRTAAEANRAQVHWLGAEQRQKEQRADESIG